MHQTYYFLFDVVCHSNRLETRLDTWLAKFLVVLLLVVKFIVATKVPLFSFAGDLLSFHPTIPWDSRHLLARHFSIRSCLCGRKAAYIHKYITYYNSLLDCYSIWTWNDKKFNYLGGLLKGQHGQMKRDSIKHDQQKTTETRIAKMKKHELQDSCWRNWTAEWHMDKAKT